MNTKSIVAALVVLGTSTVALAAPCEPTPAPTGNVHTVYQPPQSTSHNWGHGPVVIETKPVIVHHPIRIPLLVANDTQFAQDGRTFITVGADKGQFDKLTIKAEAGRTFVKQVYVQFADGSEKVLRNLDSNLDGGQALTLSITDRPEAIKRVVVYGTGSSIGFRHQASDFDVTLL